VSNERVSGCEQLRILLFELVTGRTSERPLSLKESGKTKPDQRGHVIKLFFHISGALTLVTAMGQLVFLFPTKRHTSAKISYFELVRVLGDLCDTECQRF
jgi:hypothetical protein